MRRREFIATSTSALAAFPSTVGAQRAGPRPTIGFIGVSESVWASWTAGFVSRLSALGWVEGRTITIEWRWTNGRTELYPQFAAELVARKVDVIVTSGAAVPALKQATSTIPIVFAVSNDPVAAGLVASLARPGGNVTGLALIAPELGGKRLELLREAVPRIKRLGIIFDAAFAQAVLEKKEIQTIAPKFGIEVSPHEIRQGADIEPAIAALKGKADALYVVINELLNAHRPAITRLAVEAGLPSVYGTRDWALSGGMISYGPNFPNLFARSAEMTDKILRGANPADIPVEQPTRFELVINLKTATALGIEVPPMLLARADEVIE